MLWDGIRHLFEMIFLVVAALFPIVDPLGAAPMYLAMISPLNPAERVRMARLVAFNSFFLLLISVLVGAYVLDFFGVSIPAVQVGGGFIVCTIGFSFLTSPSGPVIPDRAAAPGPDALSQRAFYPLTMPLTVGPGSISVAVTLGANPPNGLRPLFATTVAHVLGVLIIALSIYFCYRYAERILHRLGVSGTNVLIRLSSFILFCIGVQIMWNGLHALITEVTKPPV